MVTVTNSDGSLDEKTGAVKGGWTQTKGCNPDGKREPANYKKCDKTLVYRDSGFCVCADGSKTMEGDCAQSSLKFPTCTAACNAKFGV